MCSRRFRGVLKWRCVWALMICGGGVALATACGRIGVERLDPVTSEEGGPDEATDTLETGTNDVDLDGGTGTVKPIGTDTAIGNTTDTVTNTAGDGAGSASDSMSDAMTDFQGGTDTGPDSDAGEDSSLLHTEQDAGADTGVESDTASDTATDTEVMVDTDTVADAGDDAGADGGGAPEVDEVKELYGYYMGYESWNYPADDVELNSLTHLIVGRIIPAEDGTLSSDFDMTEVTGPAMATDMAARARAAGRIPILMIDSQASDGWDQATSDAIRPTFVQNLLATMDGYGFDGLDLAWTPSDDDAFDRLGLLADELRAEDPDITLSFSIGWVGVGQSVSPSMVSAAIHFDKLFVATMQMGNDWQGWQSWHSAPIYGHTPTTPSSIETTVQFLVEAGVPAEKLVITLPFHGSCWEGVTGPKQDDGVFIHPENTMTYARIMTEYFSPEHRTWDAIARVPYLSFTEPTGADGCTFISYDDPDSIQEKGAFIHEAGLGGAFMWTMAQGYLAENDPGERNPLLKAAGTAVLRDQGVL